MHATCYLRLYCRLIKRRCGEKMPDVERKKLNIMKQLFSDWDTFYWLVVAIAIVFSVIAINKEFIFGYMRNANHLNYAEQKVFNLKEESFQCGDLRENISSIVLIPEMNEDTGEITRYLLLINYTVTNTTDKIQEFVVKYVDRALLNDEECYVELAEKVDLSEEFTTGIEQTSTYALGNETTNEYYYALWIYKDYSKSSYYSTPRLSEEKALIVGVGLQNYQEEKVVYLGLLMSGTALIIE